MLCTNDNIRLLKGIPNRFIVLDLQLNFVPQIETYHYKAYCEDDSDAYKNDVQEIVNINNKHYVEGQYHNKDRDEMK